MLFSKKGLFSWASLFNPLVRVSLCVKETRGQSVPNINGKDQEKSKIAFLRSAFHIYRWNSASSPIYLASRVDTIFKWFSSQSTVPKDRAQTCSRQKFKLLFLCSPMGNQKKSTCQLRHPTYVRSEILMQQQLKRTSMPDQTPLNVCFSFNAEL